jgi:uncharacterized membrane protein
MDKKLYWVSVGLAVIGVLVSIYMTIYKLTDNNNMCIGNHGCSVVNSSPYASVYGIPVALIGVVGYAAILAVLYMQDRVNKFFKENSILMVFGMAITGFVFTLYLIYLEIYVIKALCPFCLTSQIVMTILFFVTVTRLIRQPIN